MFKVCLSALFAVLFCSAVVYAGTLTLDQIGALSTNGKMYSEWWYTGTNPVLSGKDSSNSKITITIDNVSYNVKADSSGNWLYSPTTISSGDHKISIVSGGGNISFTLHAGQNLPSSSTQSTQSTAVVPNTGSNEFFGILAFSLFAGFCMYMYRRNYVKTDFEKDVLKDL